MFQYQAFIFTLLGVLLGVFCGNILFGTQTVLFFVVGIAIFSILLLFILKKYHIVFLFSVIGLFFGVAYSQYYLFQVERNFSVLEKSFHQKSITFTGEVRELYKKSPDFHTYILDIEQPINNKIVNIGFTFTVSPYLSFDYKEKVIISGKLDKIDNFSSSFDMKRFMLVKHVYGKISYGNVEKLGSEKKKSFLGKIFYLRQTLLTSIYEQYPEKEALLLAGVLLGARENIPSDMQSDFNNSGLTHLMAVSGFNITILIFFALFIAKFFPIFLRIIIITFIIVFFTLLVGDAVPVLRASIMGLLSYYILMMGRQSDALALLLFTAFILILFNPLTLNYDISFHLSFLAVLGLLYFQEFWRKICKFLPNIFAIQESFVLTLAAMTPTLPIMIFTFGQVSILAPVANMLVGGMIPFTMFFGFLTLIISFISDVGAYWVGYISYFCLKLVNEIAHFFGQLEMSVWKYEAGELGVYLEITYFLLLIFFIFYLQNKKTPA